MTIVAQVSAEEYDALVRDAMLWRTRNVVLSDGGSDAPNTDAASTSGNLPNGTSQEVASDSDAASDASASVCAQIAGGKVNPCAFCDSVEHESGACPAMPINASASGLTERLRAVRDFEYVDGRAVAAHGDPLCEEAADELDRLARELAETQMLNAAAWKARGLAEDAAEAAEAELARARATIANHNWSVEASCGANNEYNKRRNVCDSYLPRGRNCPDCPRNWLIDEGTK